MKTRGAIPVTARQDPGRDYGNRVRTSAQARRCVRRALGTSGSVGRHDGPLLDDVLLVASELVTNAQLHAGGVTGFAVVVGRASVTVSVSDASPRTPRYELPDALRPGGFGWPIVLHLCREVTVDAGPAGKTVRAVVATGDRRG